MIKKVSLLIALLAVTTLVAAKEVVIGNETINFPVQKGFVELPDTHFYTDYMRDFTPKTNELLVIQAPQDELTQTLEMKSDEFSKSIVVQTFRGTKHRQVTVAEFGQVKDFMKQNFEKINETLRERIDSEIDSSTRKVSEKYDVDVALSITDIVPLEIFADTANHYGSMHIIKGNVAVDGEGEEFGNVLMSMNILLVKGKIIYLYVYSADEGEASQKELLNLTRETVNLVLHSN